jgi:hypothetical protein
MTMSVRLLFMCFFYIYAMATMTTNAIENGSYDNGSSSITLRFRNGILNRLRHEAKQKRINVNTLCSQIIGDHTEYSSYASTSGMISFPKSLLMRMMEGLNENEVEKLSKHIAKNEFKDLILLLTGEYSLKSYLDTVEAWLRISNFQYSYNVDKENKHRLVIQHDMGKRWSLYFEKLFSHAFHSLNLAGSRLQWEITDNIVAFTIQE